MFFYCGFVISANMKEYDNFWHSRLGNSSGVTLY